MLVIIIITQSHWIKKIFFTKHLQNKAWEVSREKSPQNEID